MAPLPLADDAGIDPAVRLLPFRRVVTDRMDVLADHVRGRSVLDLGCVDSRRARHAEASDRIRYNLTYKANLLHQRLAQSAGDLLGVDIDPDGVSVLNGMGFEAVVGDVETMDPVGGRRFDVVVAGELIEHLENPGLFLRNMRRHLVPRGCIAVSTPNPFYAGSAWKIWRTGLPAVHEEHMGWQDPITLAQLFRRTGYDPFDGCWVQPHAKLLKTWKRVLRPYFSHTFLMLARKVGD